MARRHVPDGTRKVRLALAAALIALIPSISSSANPPSREELEAKKLSAEVDKLQAEIGALKAAKTSPWYWLPWIQAVGLGSLIGGGLVLWAGSSLSRIQKKKAEQDLIFGQDDHRLQSRKLAEEMGISRSQHNLALFEALGSRAARVRIGAASELGQRVRELNELRSSDLAAVERNAVERERQTIIRVLIAVTKYEDSEPLQKHVADLLVDVLGASKPDLPKSPLADYDFQGAILTNAWWKRVDARQADFYKATLARAGMANSRLSQAIFKNADLHDATLKEADGEGANFAKANLSGVKAEGANFKGADLREAVVTGADFSNACLRGAKLQGVDLQSAKTCSGADLSDVETDSRTKLP